MRRNSPGTAQTGSGKKVNHGGGGGARTTTRTKVLYHVVNYDGPIRGWG